jgi:hypothetical protein
MDLHVVIEICVLVSVHINQSPPASTFRHMPSLINCSNSRSNPSNLTQTCRPTYLHPTTLLLRELPLHVLNHAQLLLAHSSSGKIATLMSSLLRLPV